MGCGWFDAREIDAREIVDEPSQRRQAQLKAMGSVRQSTPLFDGMPVASVQRDSLVEPARLGGGASGVRMSVLLVRRQVAAFYRDERHFAVTAASISLRDR